jgi:hypothetical protein
MYITKNAPIREIGIAIIGMIVVRQSLRKRNIISTTSKKATIIVCSTSVIDSLIYFVTSKPINVVIAGPVFYKIHL